MFQYRVTPDALEEVAPPGVQLYAVFYDYITTGIDIVWITMQVKLICNQSSTQSVRSWTSDAFLFALFFNVIIIFFEEEENIRAYI